MTVKDTAKNVLETLLEGTDYGTVLTEQQRTKLTEMINEAVDARVSAKETFLTEEFAKKEKVLTEAVAAEKERLLKESEENEKVLVEQAEKFKKEIEEVAIAQTKEYKVLVEKQIAEKAEQYKKDIEAAVFEEAKAYKDRKDAVLVEEVKNFKDDLITKVSDYLEAKVEESIPSELKEATAKLQVYEPLVKNIMESFSKNYVKLDDTSYSLIKESKDTIAQLQKELQEEKKRNISILKEKKEVERNMKIELVTEGLTQDQRSRAKKLLEGVNAEEIEPKFKQIRDIILESNVKPTVAAKTKPVEPKTAEKVIPLTESAKPQQESEVQKMQQKAVLKELENKKTETKKPVPLNESENQVNSWAQRVKPKYANG